MRRLLANISPTKLLWLLMGVWWVVNIFQAAFTELANDEAYYYLFAQRLDWGYFDHPPMVALLVWLGQWVGGELGVRLLSLSLQPLYLVLLFLIIKPLARATREDVVLFFVITAAIPMLQLYGFIAVPDVPLMFFTALLLFAYHRFLASESWASTLLLALAVTGLAYSKYQGALVVIFLLLSNVRLLTKAKVYVAAGVALLLILPHIIWLYNNDFLTVNYHLTERINPFKWSNVTAYLLNLVAVFNPFLFPLYIVAMWRLPLWRDPMQRALLFIAVGFVGFFGLTTLRGSAQPQWIIPITFSLVAWLFALASANERVRRYVVRVGVVTIVLIALVRIEMVFNPLGLRMEIFGNKECYGAIAEQAQGRTVIFAGGYGRAAKYIFYTAEPAFCQPSVGYRSSQWQFTDGDTRAAGDDVLIECWNVEGETTIEVPTIKSFTYKVVEDFRPVRLVQARVDGQPTELQNDSLYTLSITFTNPYNYPIVVGGDGGHRLEMLLSDRMRNVSFFDMSPTPTTIPANGTAHLVASFTPSGLDSGEYVMGVTIRQQMLSEFYNSKPWRVQLR